MGNNQNKHINIELSLNELPTIFNTALLDEIRCIKSNIFHQILLFFIYEGIE